jgi:hypothetical protein
VNKQDQPLLQLRAWPVLVTLTVMLMLAACGGRATPTPVPPTAVPPTAVPPTAVPPTAIPTTAPPTVAPTPEATVAPTAAPAPEATAEPEPQAAEDVSYPAPTNTAEPTVQGDYPPPTLAPDTAPDSYPAPVELTPEFSRIPIVPFVMERPLIPGATVIRGTGPANVPIVVADIFLMGEILGEGVIGADGTFEITVPPLAEGHWIGVAVADLSGTEFLPEDFYASGFRGPGAEQVPQVGFIFDTDFVR